MQNQTIFELYTDDDKSKYSRNPKDILKSAKKKNIYIYIYIKKLNLQVMMAFQQNFINFSNELAPVLLDVYDSWEKLDPMGITYRTGIISAIYKR